MSHEKTITLKIKGKYRNIPSVIPVLTRRGVRKKTVSQEKAKAHALKTGKIGKGYKSIDSAVSAAKKRSSSFNKKK